MALGVGAQHLLAIGDRRQPPSSSGVRVTLGQTQFTVTWSRARSRAAARARFSSAPWRCSRRTCHAPPAARRGWRAARWPRPARAHLARGLAHQQEGAADIDAHDALEIHQRRVEDRTAIAQHPGAGDRHIDGSQLRWVVAKASTTVVSSASPSKASARRPSFDALCRLGGRPRRPVEQSEIGPEIGQVSAVSSPMPEPPPVTKAVLPLKERPGRRALAHVFFPICPYGSAPAAGHDQAPELAGVGGPVLAASTPASVTQRSRRRRRNWSAPRRR
jgi:hypothetical protein